VYTITQTTKNYVMPAWTTSPSYCKDRIVYSIQSVSPSAGQTAISLSGKTFSFSYGSSTDLAGASVSGTKYTTNVLASLGQVTTSS
jgi:hypothetical protein